MERRNFIKGATLGSLAAGSGLLSADSAAAQKKTRWRMALAVSKTLPIWGPGMERFAHHVESLTGGRLSIKVYGAGELVPALETFEAVKNGQLEMGHSASYYWQGRVPASPFFCAVPFGMTTEAMSAWLVDGGGQALWDELMEPHGVICFPCGSPGYQTVGWFNREINTLSDLQGLKIRIPGLAAQVYAKAGATPILLPGGEVFTSLSTGVIDAVEWVGPYHDYILGLHKAAKYLYFGSWHEPGAVLELMIHKESWDELPDDMKLAIRIAASETDRWMLALWQNKNGEYLEKIKAEGTVMIREMPVEVLKKLKEYAEAVKLEIAGSSPLARKIYDSFTKFQERFDAYHDLSERAYHRAFKL